MIGKLRDLLRGRKTYLGMIAGGVLGILWSYGLVDDAQARLWATLIVTFTGVSMRAAVGKAER